MLSQNRIKPGELVVTTKGNGIIVKCLKRKDYASRSNRFLIRINGKKIIMIRPQILLVRRGVYRDENL